MDGYQFRVYNRRFNSDVTYRISKTESGWNIEHVAINGECSPDGTPFFYKNFDQNNINYPSNFGGFLEFIWRKLNRHELSDSDAQIRLQELADWVSACERSQPIWTEWNP